MPIKRYHPRFTMQEKSPLVENPGGEWYRHEDVAELVEALRPFAQCYAEMLREHVETGQQSREWVDEHFAEHKRAHDLLVRWGELEPSGEGEE